MAVLIYPPHWPAHGRLWSHLVSDVSVEELHAFARSTGLPDRGFEGDHYDVPQERYAGLVAAGAHPVSSRELLGRLVAAGLRRPKRRGERVLASHPSGDPAAPGRVDTVMSALPPRGAVHAVVLLAVHEHWLLTEAALPRPPRVLLTQPAADAGGRVPPDPASWDAVRAALVTHHLEAVTGGVRQVGYLRLVGPAPTAPVVDLVVTLTVAVTGARPTVRWRDAAEVARRNRPLAPLIDVALGHPPGLTGR